VSEVEPLAVAFGLFLLVLGIWALGWRDREVSFRRQALVLAGLVPVTFVVCIAAGLVHPGPCESRQPLVSGISWLSISVVSAATSATVFATVVTGIRDRGRTLLRRGAVVTLALSILVTFGVVFGTGMTPGLSSTAAAGDAAQAAEVLFGVAAFGFLIVALGGVAAAGYRETLVGPAWRHAAVLSIAILVPLLSLYTMGSLVSVVAACPSYHPQAAFGFEYDSDTNKVTIQHRGGTNFTRENTGRLLVQVDNETRRTLSDDLPLSAGNQTTVGVDPGAVVRVVWYDAGGDEHAVVGQYRVFS
jgi:hypothetical protein